MTTETRPTEVVPIATLATVNTRTWVDTTDDGAPIPCLMLTYPAPQFDDADPEVVEATMRQVAQSLGAVPAGEPVPDVGVRLTLRGGVALLWFPETGYALKVEHPRWVRALEQFGAALLAVGLDELSQVASVAEVDEYRQNTRAAGRLHFALARVGRRIGGVS
ncbi:hypothetical protein SUDANB1_05232 [Streptomyces sp. enrichment culture]|uniref:hypothetical protein n=1 Tax=Streptomyces sp. enrichment culture TaxID=1795815 RepID=UPI003F56CB43